MSYSSSGWSNPFGFALTPWVKRLLVINGVVFLITLAFSGLLPYLAFTPAEVLREPWTPLTYMFVHGSFWHLFFNMIGLFFFGPPLEERWGSTEFLKFFLICGFGGALLSLLSPGVAIVGASGAVFGVMLAYALYWPDNPIYIWGILPVKAKWLIGFLVVFTLFSGVFGRGAGVAHLAHLGGFAAAFLYLRSPWAPSAWGSSRRSSGESALPEGLKRLASLRRSANRRSEQDAEVVHDNTRRIDREREEEVLDEIDRILDKISERGLASLTADERRQLEQASRRFRTH